MINGNIHFRAVRGAEMSAAGGPIIGNIEDQATP
jgi:hypothetical protein